MYTVTSGAVHHKGEVYRKGQKLPETFKNKEGYKHVAWKGKGLPPSAKDKVAENAELEKLKKENEELKAKIAELEKEPDSDAGEEPSESKAAK